MISYYKIRNNRSFFKHPFSLISIPPVMNLSIYLRVVKSKGFKIIKHYSLYPHMKKGKIQ